MEESLVQEFNDTAAAAYEAFPQKLERLVILLTPSSDTPVYVSPAIVDQLTKSTADIKAAVKERTNYMKNHDAAGLAERNYYLAGTFVEMISLKENPGGSFSQRYTQEMELIFNLDHEIGHHILRNGYPSYKEKGYPFEINGPLSSEVSGYLAESAAEAFAMLRHIQRFGRNTGYAGACGVSRIVLHADPDHYTTDAVQTAIRISEEMGDKIFGISLQETAVLAEQIADDCKIDDVTLSRVNAAFWPVQALYNEGAYHDRLCREVVSVMREHRDDPDVFKAGKQFLSDPAQKSFITAAALRDPYWQGVLDLMENKDLRIADKREIDYETLLNTNDAFRSVHEFYSKRNVLSEKAYNIMLCRMVVSIMRERQNDPDVFKAGSRFLSQPERKYFITAAAQSGDTFWRDALVFMKNHQPKPAKRGFLRRKRGPG